MAWLLHAVAAFWLGACTAQAVIVLEGLTDRQVVWEPLRFRVVPLEGYTDQARLDGVDVSPEAWVDEPRVGYHEFTVTRRPLGGEASETARYQFIILDPARGATEAGLETWTPRPLIDSGAAEFAGTELTLVLPASYPSDMSLPVIAQVLSSEGRRATVNGPVLLREGNSAATELMLRRGIGSAFIASENQAGDLSVEGRVQNLVNHRTVSRDPETTWQEAPLVISEDTTWAANGRIFVRSNLTIRAGAKLTIESGTVFGMAPATEINVDGTLEIRGTITAPVVFAPREAGKSWGGFLLLAGPASLVATGTLVTGTGADARFYYDRPLGSAHRGEQPAVHLGAGAQARFTDCWFVDLQGQAFHGENAALTLERTLVQRCLTGGQFNGGSVVVRESALIEFPLDDPVFADGDNDGIYLTLGDHHFSDTLIGWAKDDGIDAGGGTPGNVRVERCWFESCFHEGMALSGTDKIINVVDSVFLNNGQGAEAGYGSPRVTLTDSLVLANGVGARFGDNYGPGGVHDGFLQVTNSMLLENRRDVWGFALTRWAEAVDRMDLTGNWITTPHGAFAVNTRWDGQSDGSKLSRFRVPAGTDVGTGFLRAESRWAPAAGPAGIAVGLSSFCEQPVRVDYEVEPGTAVEGVDYVTTRGTLTFAPGQIERTIQLPLLANDARPFSRSLRLTLANPERAQLTSRPVHQVRLLVTPREGDADADGLPDAWEARVTGASTTDPVSRIEEVQPDEDFDTDGMLNQDEYLGGTDPTLPGSRLQLRVERLSSTEAAIEFEALPGKSYRVETAAQLGESPAWQEFWVSEPGSAPGTHRLPIPIPSSPNAALYRLVVLP